MMIKISKYERREWNGENDESNLHKTMHRVFLLTFSE